MPFQPTEDEKEVMEKYGLDETDMKAVRRTCAAFDLRARSERAELDAIAAKEAAKKKKEEEDINVL